MHDLIALMLLAGATGATETGYSRSQLERMSVGELAATFLPAGTAGRITERQFGTGLWPEANYSGIVFKSAPHPQGSGVCVRDLHLVSLTPVAGISEETLRQDSPAKADGVSPTFEIALADDCTSVASYAHLNWLPVAFSADLLRFVVSLRDAARTGRALPVEVQCRSEFEPDPCRRDIREVIADLPVEKPRIVNRLSRLEGGGYSVALSEAPLPSLYWEVRLDDEPAKARQVTLSWKIPAPF